MGKSAETIQTALPEFNDSEKLAILSPLVTE
jgi:hypothetical protein